MSKEKIISGRIYAVYMAVFVFALLIIYKIFSIQMTVKPANNPYVSSISEVEIKASRGNIFADDKEKSALAISVPIYELRMDLVAVKEELFTSKVDSLAICLSKVFGSKSKTEYRKELIDAKASGRRYHLLKKNVSYNDLQAIIKAPILRKGQFRGGRIVLKQNKREKPFGMLAQRTVGYINEDGNGVGLEDAYQDKLKGEQGLQYMKSVGGGNRIPLTDDYLIKPENGKDIYTTIDVNLQDVAEKALMGQLVSQNAQHGCAVLMEVETGHIKAIANISRDRRGNYREIYNHAIGTSSEPGSTFKLASIMVALEDGKVDVNDLVDTRNGTISYYDRTMRDAHEGGDGIIPLWHAFAISSNVGISSVINENYKKNQTKFLKGIKRLGLGENIGLEIKGERKPYVKTTSDSTWSGISIPWMSIGYETRFTPLQILTFYNAVANGGVMVKPQFVKEIRDGSVVTYKSEVEVLNSSICSQKTIKNAQFLLEKVVEEGTARNLRNLDFKIAGKTGTTQVGYGKSDSETASKVRHQASFCGYFPADNPKYSCIVVVAAPTKSIYGNVVSGTVFKEIAEKVYATDIEMARTKDKLENKNMPASKSGNQDDLKLVFSTMMVPLDFQNKDSKWTSTFAKEDKVTLGKKEISELPNTLGMGLKDAVYLLENKGYSVRVNGKGVVKSQSELGGNKKVMVLNLG
ncbi:penicillin-binding transpeptidase domain-containing protein [Flavobacteriales bacterium]|nr:penicillin-binding transpeptidase domain-containing protein [Flavobacteriales bacterium]